MAVYVASDIHGQYDLLIKALGRVDFSEDDYLWVLGDAIDRGPDGIRILSYIMSNDNMDLIIGNHELMMINAVSEDGMPLCGGMDSKLWLLGNGGDVTFEGYKKLFNEERLSLLDWLKSRYVIKIIDVNGKSYCLTHSYYSKSCENKKYNELSYRKIWNVTWSSIWREDYDCHALDIYSDYEYTFVNGHVAVQLIRNRKDPLSDWNHLEALHHNNVINIDGGCGWGIQDGINNGLILIRLDDMEEFYTYIN